MTLKSTTEIFIIKSRKIHGIKYNYEKVNYTGAHQKVIIICYEHGEFSQMATSHLSGSGCPICKKEKIGNLKRKNENFVIQQMASIHNYRYDYSKVNYESTIKNVEIICSEHGSFFQTPSMHLSGQGCPKCGRVLSDQNRKYTQEEFITIANKIHNNSFDYSKTKYAGIYIPIIIICKKHGEFFQRPTHHIQGMGCKKCINIISKQETQWLDSLKVPTEYRQVYIALNNKKYYFDAYNPITNTVYEYYGDYWHGNPKNLKFKSDDINKRNKKTFGQLYNSTINREVEIQAAGYNLISIWEYDWKLLNKLEKL